MKLDREEELVPEMAAAEAYLAIEERMKAACPAGKDKALWYFMTEPSVRQEET